MNADRPVARTRRRDFLRLGGLVWPGAAAAVTAGAAAQPRQPESLRVVQIAPFSGPLGEVGQMFSSGVRLYFDSVNASGGVDGRKLLLEQRDDGYSADRAAEQFRAALREGTPLACLTFGTKPSTQVQIEAQAMRAAVPIFPTGTGARVLRYPFDRNLFHIRASYSREVSKIIDILSSTGLVRWAVVYQDDAFGRDGLLAAQDALKRLGLASATELPHARENYELDAQAQLAAAQGVQAVLLMTNGRAAPSFIRSARRIGLAATLAGVSDLDPEDLRSTAGSAAVGVVVSQVFPPVDDLRVPLIKEFSALVAASGGRTRQNGWVLEGYIQGKVIHAGIRRAARLDGEGVIGALERMGPFNAGGYWIRFSPRNREGADYVDTAMIARNGRLLR